MNRKLLLAALFITVSLPLAAQVNDTYVITAAANVPGAFGTRWMTQFSLFNPQLDHDLNISVTYQPTGGGPGLEEIVTVPRNSVAYSDNILADLFDVNGTGSLFVATFREDNPTVPNSVLARSFVVTTNTYNNSSNGTFGQTIPGVWAGLQDFDVDGISAVAHGIRNIARDGWRTNIGASNLGRCSVTLFVSVYDVNGRTMLDRAPFYVPPLAHFQDRLPIEVDRGTVEFFVDDPCANDATKSAVVFPYVSTIDQLSGDPTYQSPTLLAPPSSLFSKGATESALRSPGRKLDATIAKGVRENAVRKGFAHLVVQGNGYRIMQ